MAPPRIQVTRPDDVYISVQRRKNVTDDDVRAFMDANRIIVPTLEKKIHSV